MVRRVGTLRQLKNIALLVAAVAAITISERCGAATVEEARAAIAEAERAMAQAQALRALWSTAEEALRQAQRALEAGDAAAALKYANVAAEHAALGMAQKRYPLFR